MTKKNIIKMILLQFGYKNIEIETFWTGTNDGATENSLAYEIEAEDGGGDCLSVRESCFQEAVQQVFYEVTDTSIADRLVCLISENDFKKLR